MRGYFRFPIYPAMADDDVDSVINAVGEIITKFRC